MITFLKKLFKWIKIIIYNFNESTPIYAKRTEPGLRLHLGSGEINLQGWVNIDARSFTHTHLQTDKIDLDEFLDESLTELYMCHVLEHLSFQENEDLINTFFNKLKQGGILRISVPDFDAIVKIYLNNGNDLLQVQQALMGGQDYEYNFHKAVFNQKTLSHLLEKCGFSNIEEWNTQNDFGKSIGDWSDGVYKTDIGKLPISLNLKALKK